MERKCFVERYLDLPLPHLLSTGITFTQDGQAHGERCCPASEIIGNVTSNNVWIFLRRRRSDDQFRGCIWGWRSKCDFHSLGAVPSIMHSDSAYGNTEALQAGWRVLHFKISPLTTTDVVLDPYSTRPSWHEIMKL